MQTITVRRAALAAMAGALFPSLLFPSLVWAQQSLPPGATAGSPARLDERAAFGEMQPEAVPIPPVMERPLDVNEGPRIIVQGFEVSVDGGLENSWRDGAWLPGVEAILEDARITQPPGGMTIPQLEGVTRKVTEHLRGDGLVLAQAYIPVQDVQGGVIRIEVLQGRLGRVVLEGNDRYSENRLLQPFEDLVGGAVDQQGVESALLHLTDYPGLTAFGVFGAGQGVGQTDLSIKVQNERLFDFGVSADNYGSEFTGEQRIRATGSVNNMFGAADRLTLSVLATGDPTNSIYGSFDYHLPLFGYKNTFGFGYSRNDFDVAQAAEAAGLTDIGSVYWRRSIVRSRNSNLYTTLDLASKVAQVSVNGEVEGEDELTVASLITGFDNIDTRFRGINQGTIGVLVGIPDFLGSFGSDGDGTSIRQGGSGEFSGSDFVKFVGTFSRLQRLTNNSSLLLRVEAQQSDDLLPTLEQYALGGPSNVRAYAPAEVQVDTGGFASLELILNAPGFASKPAFGNRLWGEVFQVSAFYDYAGGINSDPNFGQQKTEDLSGYGVAVQLSLPGKFLFRTDVAWPRGSFEPSNDREPQYYGRFYYSF
ncbi:MAG: ShlB/FhaC/HecB family hemolysin secretion/activation protein [Pseudomonadota bacterium]